MKSNVMMILMLAVIGFCGESAFGQAFAPPSAPRAPRPTLSPYLNLLDRNNSTTFNYYNRVRPRQAFDDYAQQQARNLSALQRQVNRNREAIVEQSENSQLAPSGHSTRFMDLGGYFGTGPAPGQFGGGSIGRR